MSEHIFKPGDKVRVKSNSFTEYQKIAGKIGVVKDDSDPLHLTVGFEDGVSYKLFPSSLEPFELTLTPDVSKLTINTTSNMVVDTLMFKPKKCAKGHVSDMAIASVYGAEFNPPLCQICFAEYLAAALKDVGRVVEE